MLTVLMSVHNGAAHLRAAIESILAQTWADFRFLIVDDASTDDSRDIIRSYHDPRIEVLPLENRHGLTAALNLGLARIQTPFTARMDADDLALPERLEKQMALFQSAPERIAVVGAWMQEWAEDNAPCGMRRGSLRTHADFLWMLLSGRNALHHPAVIFRTEAVRSLGGYDETYATAQDYELWLRLGEHGHDARIVETPLLRYRVHAGQISAAHPNAQQANKRRAHLAFLQRLGAGAHADQMRSYFLAERVFMDRLHRREDIAAFAAALTKVTERLLEGARISEADETRFRALAAEHARAWCHRASTAWDRGAAMPLWRHAWRLAPRPRDLRSQWHLLRTALVSAPLPGMKKARRHLREYKERNDLDRKRALAREDKEFRRFMARTDRAAAAADIGAIIYTVEPSHLFDRACASVEAQTLRPAQIEIVRNIAPVSAAVMTGLARIRTRYVVSVDDDMILRPDCFARLYCGLRSTPDCAECIMPLQDPILGRIMGIHMFDMKLLRAFRLPEAMAEKGLDRRITRWIAGMGQVTRTLRQSAGAHHPVYLPHEAFWKFRFAAEKDRYYGKVDPALPQQLEALLCHWKRSRDAAAIFGILGILDGLNSPDISRELSYEGRMQDPAYLELVPLVARFFESPTKEDGA